jgi:hypothetical protein
MDRFPTSAGLHPFYQHIFSSTNIACAELKQCRSAFRDGQLLISCNGSYDPVLKRASFGVAVASPQAPIVYFSGPCPGSPLSQSALRAELCSITATLFFLQHLNDAFQLDSGSALIYNDCLKAVKLINAPGRKFKRFLTNDYDLQNESRILLCNLNKALKVHLNWVKSHYRGEDKQVQHILNEDAHRMATSFLHPETTPQHDLLAPNLNSSLLLTSYLHSDWQSHALDALLAPPLQKTIRRSTLWNDSQMELVDWGALRCSLRLLPRVRQLSYIKLIHGLLNTNAQNNKYYTSDPLCPHCRLCHESQSHIFMCSSPVLVEFRSAQLNALKSSLASIDTPHVIIDHLLMGIRNPLPEQSMHLETPLPTAPSQSDTSSEITLVTMAAFKEQSILGWDQLLCGRLSKRWKEAYSQVHLLQHHRVNKDQWSTKLVTLLPNFSLTLWRFRCNLLHGRTTVEAHQLQQQTLRNQVSAAYQEYAEDPHIISQQMRHMFNIPLTRRLNHDLDSLACFLESYNQARVAQEIYKSKLAATAKNFFKPSASRISGLVNPFLFPPERRLESNDLTVLVCLSDSDWDSDSACTATNTPALSTKVVDL